MKHDFRAEQIQRKWAEIVAKSWIDESFKKELIKHPEKVLKEHGIDLHGIHCVIYEDTEKMVHFTVPKKHEEFLTEKQMEELALHIAKPMPFFSSSKHFNVKEMQKKWAEIVVKCWKSDSFQKELIQHPQRVLKEHGIDLHGMRCAIYENTHDTVHLALARKPEGHLSEKQLKDLAAGVSKPYAVFAPDNHF